MDKPITGARGTDQEEANRQLVLGFYENVIINREFDRWPEYLRPDYKQHKPNIPDGPEAVLDFMRANYAADPDHTVTVVRSFADGDYVILHVKIGLKRPVEQELSVMDIFRAEDGILVEHWDVEQPIPAKMMHENGMI
jgi:predicted SnoaL-like aldol condensation-catalyzing enzyme